jgi:hypothetical protein
MKNNINLFAFFLVSEDGRHIIFMDVDASMRVGFMLSTS